VFFDKVKLKVMMCASVGKERAVSRYFVAAMLVGALACIAF
jgi:hypothetical protein